MASASSCIVRNYFHPEPSSRPQGGFRLQPGLSSMTAGEVNRPELWASPSTELAGASAHPAACEDLGPHWPEEPLLEVVVVGCLNADLKVHVLSPTGSHL